MKKLLFTLVANSLFLAGFAQIEGFHIGGRLGVGEGSISGSGMNIQPKVAISGGIAANYQFTKYFGLNADFLLTSAGARVSGTTRSVGFLGSETYYNYKERFDLVNVEVPLTAQVNVWLGDFFVRGYIGPAMNVNLLAISSRTYDDNNYNSDHGYTNQRIDNLNNISYSMIYGIGIGALSKDDRMFFLDLRYNNGVSSIGMINNNNAFLHYYCLSVGYLF